MTPGSSQKTVCMFNELSISCPLELTCNFTLVPYQVNFFKNIPEIFQCVSKGLVFSVWSFWFFFCVFTFASTCLVLFGDGFSSLFVYMVFLCLQVTILVQSFSHLCLPKAKHSPLIFIFKKNSVAHGGDHKKHSLKKFWQVFTSSNALGARCSQSKPHLRQLMHLLWKHPGLRVLQYTSSPTNRIPLFAPIGNNMCLLLVNLCQKENLKI